MNTNFVNLLSAHDLSISNEAQGSSLQSFFSVFTEELGVTQDQLVMSIRPFFEGSELSTHVLAHEFGPQSRMINSFSTFLERDFCPVMAMISAVATQYSCKIILACDEFNLAFQTKGELFCMIVPQAVERDTIIVALTKTAFFGLVIGNGRQQPEAIESTINLDSVLVLADLYDAFESSEDFSDYNESDSSLQYSDASSSTSTQSLSDYSDASSTSTRSSTSRSGTRFGQRTLAHRLGNSKTIQEYLAMNFGDGTGVNDNLIDPYTNDCSLSFYNSDYRISSGTQSLVFDRNLDLDGVFALICPRDLCDSVITGGGITKPVKCTHPHTLRSIKKHLFDIGIREARKLSVIKFGQLNDSKKFELFAVASWAAESDISHSDFDLEQLFIRCHNRAKQFTCVTAGCPFSQEHESISSSRPDNLNQIEASSYVWEYAPASFKCLSRDLAQYMEEELGQFAGVELHFYVRLIGSKFVLLTSEAKNFSELLENVAKVFAFRKLAKESPSKAFIDVSWKFLAKDSANSVNSKLFILKFYLFSFLICSLLVFGKGSGSRMKYLPRGSHCTRNFWHKTARTSTATFKMGSFTSSISTMVWWINFKLTIHRSL